jgi:hypothetical protein
VLDDQLIRLRSPWVGPTGTLLVVSSNKRLHLERVGARAVKRARACGGYRVQELPFASIDEESGEDIGKETDDSDRQVDHADLCWLLVNAHQMRGPGCLRSPICSIMNVLNPQRGDACLPCAHR